MRWLWRAALAMATLIPAGLLLAPHEPVDMPPPFDTRVLNGGVSA